MDTHTVIGGAIVCAGLADIAVARLVLPRRIPDEGQRRVVVGATMSGGVLMILLGAAIATGVLSFGGAG